MRVFIIDCPSPIEILVDKSEFKPLEQICKSMNHEVYTFFVKSKQELIDTCKYISSIDKIERNVEDDIPISIHISAHGNEDGLQFGHDEINWKLLLEVIKPILMMNYREKIHLVISACGTNKQKITKEITELNKIESINPPEYIIVFNKETTTWKDAVLAWTIFYHQADVNLSKKGKIQNLLKRIQEAEFGNLIYFRWDPEEKKYLRFKYKKK